MRSMVFRMYSLRRDQWWLAIVSWGRCRDGARDDGARDGGARDGQRQAIAALHQNQNVDTEVKTRVAPRQDANVANAGTEPVPVNRAVSPETALAPEAEPFGLAAEHVSEGEILRKWDGRRIGNS
jgi:hypothetical protein